MEGLNEDGSVPDVVKEPPTQPSVTEEPREPATSEAESEV